jgi:prepilin-type processing-associated H-X9-DG protein
LEEAREAFAPFLEMKANTKIVAEEEYSDLSYTQKGQVPGELVTAYIAMLKPAIGAARGAARRMSCMNNLKQLGLSLHNYHDSYNGLPPLYTVDAEGKPLHSWRVLLLPFFEQTALYDQIRLDEPWDSLHNKQFHNVVVPQYSCPDNPLVAPGKACTYVAINGALRPALPDNGQRPRERDTMAHWQDGTSNQFAFIEVKEPFNWMDPTADITLDELAKGVNKTGRVGSFHPGGCNVGFGDGSVRFITDAVDGALLRALGDPRDGQGRGSMLP